MLSNQAGNADSYSAMELVDALQVHGWLISNEQHDAYEFFQVLMATVNEEMDNLSVDLEIDYMNTKRYLYIYSHASSKYLKINHPRQIMIVSK